MVRLEPGHCRVYIQYIGILTENFIMNFGTLRVAISSSVCSQFGIPFGPLAPCTGVINGVKRMLDQQTQEQSEEVQAKLSQMGEKMEQDLAQRDTKMERDLAQISSQVCQMEQDLAQRDTKMKQDLAQLNANVEKIEKANSMMVQELSSRFEELLGGRRDGN